MFLYASSINPLLTRLDAALTGLRLGIDTWKVIVIVYADDVTFVITEPTEFLSYRTSYIPMNKLRVRG
jgi:hypothetical protein